MERIERVIVQGPSATKGVHPGPEGKNGGALIAAADQDPGPESDRLSSEGAEWLEIGRGFETDVTEEQQGGRKGKNSTSEIYIRNMFDAWLGYMTNGASGSANSAHKGLS